LFIDPIETLVDLVDDPTEINTETRDPEDDYLIALARANDVDFVISGADHPLTDYRNSCRSGLPGSDLRRAHNGSCGTGGRRQSGSPLGSRLLRCGWSDGGHVVG
jgi:hypothetical protein